MLRLRATALRSSRSASSGAGRPGPAMSPDAPQRHRRRRPRPRRASASSSGSGSPDEVARELGERPRRAGARAGSPPRRPAPRSGKAARSAERVGGRPGQQRASPRAGGRRRRGPRAGAARPAAGGPRADAARGRSPGSSVAQRAEVELEPLRDRVLEDGAREPLRHQPHERRELADRGELRLERRLARRCPAHVPLDRPVDEERRRAATAEASSASTPGLAVRAGELVGIALAALGREHRHLPGHAGGEERRGGLGGRGEAGAVAVEEDRHLAAVAAREELDVLRGERGAADRHRVRDAGLVQPDHVEVPLDEHRLARLADRLAGEVEPVEHLRLLVERRSRGC